jgi:hypothetical protein
MDVCDFLTWSNENKRHLRLMINSCIFMSSEENISAPSYEIVY